MSVREPLGEEYVRLAWRIQRHDQSFVDGYYGPAELKDQVADEAPREIPALLDDAARLNALLQSTRMDDMRRDYVRRQVRAMHTLLRRLGGEKLSLSEEAQGCFDIVPQRVPESEFEAGLRELDALLPGRGDLAARRVQWNRQFELPPERVMPVFEIALAEVRRRTQALLELPAGESVEVGLVSDRPWGGYNWYLGRNRSRIEVNTDLPVRADHAASLLAHEGYPGHHTEHAIKEQRWYRQAGRLEHSILLLSAPESCVAEGIATVALDVIYPDRAERAEWLRTVLYPKAGIHVDVDLQMRLEQVEERMEGLAGNAAFLLYEDCRPAEEVLEYVRHYGLQTEKEARHTLRFLSNSFYRAYVFNYDHGRKLLQQAFRMGGTREVFCWAVSEPVTPSGIAARYGPAPTPA